MIKNFWYRIYFIRKVCKNKNIKNNWKSIEKIAYLYDKKIDNAYVSIPKIPKNNNIFNQCIKSRHLYELSDTDDHIIHFPRNLLGSFYLTFYSNRMKEVSKYIAKHIHYKEFLFAEAYNIVKQMGDQKYYSIHIRRNDFQYKDLFISAEQIYENIRNVVKEGSVLYIATDADNLDFFNILNEKYTTRYYSDFNSVHNKYLNSNLIGIIEQIICSRGKIFIGNKLSTFSSYIYRLRGYMKDIENKEYYINTDKCLNYNKQKNELSIKIYPTWIKTWMNTWGREHPESWDFSYFSKETIFVSIAAYRDPELVKTIDDLFNMSEFPNRIFVGVCLQDTDDNIKKFKYNNHPNVRVLPMNYLDAKGVGYARWIIQSQLTKNETYYLQIDSHSRFKEHWDSTLINQLYQCNSNKPILSTYPNGYEIDDTKKTYLKRTTIANIGYEKWIGYHLRTKGQRPVEGKIPIPANWIAAGFLFTFMSWNSEVIFPKKILFNGEEDILFIKSVTNGWDIFCPPSSTVYHCYNDCRIQSKKKYRPLVWEDLSLNSNMDDLKDLIKGTGDIGSFRDLDDLRERYGVCYKNRLIEDWAKKGTVNLGEGKYSLTKLKRDIDIDKIDPKSFKVELNLIDLKKNYSVIIFSIENEFGEEILRDDIYNIEEFINNGSTYTIKKKKYICKNPYKYILIPKEKNGDFLQRIEREIKWDKKKSEKDRITFEINTSHIDLNLKYKSWIFAIEDINNNEILRNDLIKEDYLSGKLKTFTINDPKIIKKKPYKYIIWPLTKDDKFLERKVYKINPLK